MSHPFQADGDGFAKIDRIFDQKDAHVSSLAARFSAEAFARCPIKDTLSFQEAVQPWRRDFLNHFHYLRTRRDCHYAG